LYPEKTNITLQCSAEKQVDSTSNYSAASAQLLFMQNYTCIHTRVQSATSSRSKYPRSKTRLCEKTKL